MLEELTIPQRKAVVDRGGDLLVSAAAGSGKTKVLVERLMQCINDPISPANIDDFLIITYNSEGAHPTYYRESCKHAFATSISEIVFGENLNSARILLGCFA